MLDTPNIKCQALCYRLQPKKGPYPPHLDLIHELVTIQSKLNETQRSSLFLQCHAIRPATINKLHYTNIYSKHTH